MFQHCSGESLSITNRETVTFIPAVGKVRGVQDPITPSEISCCFLRSCADSTGSQRCVFRRKIHEMCLSSTGFPHSADSELCSFPTNRHTRAPQNLLSWG